MNETELDWTRDPKLEEDVKDPLNWCEISLGSEEEKEVRGELVFRRRESESSSKDSSFDTPPSPNPPPQDTSLAYQFGMMVVSGAAQVVSNVADVGRRNHDVIKAMTRELDDVRAEHEDTKEKLKESQKWASCYESINSELEHRIQELSNEQETELKKHKQQLNKQQSQTGKATKKLANSKNECKKLKEEMDKLTKDKQALAEQIEELRKQKHLQESNLKVKTETSDTASQVTEPPSDRGTNDVTPSTSDVTSDDVINKDEHDALVVQIKLYQRQVNDATNALRIAHSRGDKLRQQLMTSMSSMTSQSQRMQESTKALEVALDNVKELKSSLDCERTMRNNLESELSNLEDANRGLNNDLMDREREVIRLSSLIPAVTSSSDVAVQVDVREDFDDFADGLSRDVIRDVMMGISRSTHDDIVTQLKNEVKSHSDRAIELELTRLGLLQRVSRLNAILEERKTELGSIKGQVGKLSYENEALRAKMVELGKISKVESSRMGLELKKTQNQLNQVLKSRSREMAHLRCQIEELTAENSKFKILRSDSDVSTQNTCDDVSVRDVGQSSDDVKEHSRKIEALESENRRLIQKIQESAEFETRFAEVRSELSRAQTANQELRMVLTNERRSSAEANHVVQRLSNQCRRLDWACRMRQEEVTQFRHENAVLQREVSGSTVTSQVQNTDLNGSNYNTETTGATLDTIQEENSSNSSSSVERVNDVTPSSSMTSSNDQESVASGSQQDIMTSHTTQESVTSNSITQVTSQRELISSASDVSSVVSYYVRDDDVTSQSSRRSVPRPRGESRKKKMKRRQDNDVTSTSASSLNSLPIWRRENPENLFHASDIGSDDVTLDDVTIDDEVFSINEPSTSRQIGIPMSSERFQRVVESCGNDVDLSRDDGYSSSTNIDDVTQGLIWESTVGHPSYILPDTSEERHYYVTYAGVTFDLAMFSMSRMRDVTSSCGATSSPEAMNAFFDFLARKTEELEGDPQWRGRHNLGRPSDWLNLKSCFA